MNSKKHHILLVEDNPADAKLFQLAVEEAGADLSIAVVADGIQAIEYITRSGSYGNVPLPGLVVLDLNLPRMDGHEVVLKLKSDPAFALLPIVVLSSSANPADIQRAYRQGVSAYLQKPADADRMFEMTRALINYWFNLVRLPESGNDA